MEGIPQRDDQVEAWLESWLDMLDGDGWIAVNGMLEDYRCYADQAVPLSQEAGG